MRIEARETIKQREIKGIEKESERGVGVSEAREENKIKKEKVKPRREGIAWTKEKFLTDSLIIF